MGLCAALAAPATAQVEQPQDATCPEAEAFLGPGHPPDCQGGEDISIWLYQPREVITVTARGIPALLRQVGQAATVLDRAQIEQVQGADLPRVLARVPGVTVSRNGGAGSYTSVQVRGAAGSDLLVLVDGIRLADPAAPAGGFDMGNLLTGAVGRVELLRGSNSTVWGSDAVGGVLSITPPDSGSLAASVETGTQGFLFATASARVSQDEAEAGLALSHFATDGFSAASSGLEPDGFRQQAATAWASVDQLVDDIGAFLRVQYAAGRVELDGYPAPDYVLADTAEFQQTRQFSYSSGLKFDYRPIVATLSYAVTQTERDLFDPAVSAQPGFSSDGHTRRLEAKAQLQDLGRFDLVAGADLAHSWYRTSFDARSAARTAGAFAQLGYQNGISAHAGVRYEDHADFGGVTSFGADVVLPFASGWRLVSSVGQGFRAPSLFQLNSNYGNAALQPERSTSFDLGLRFAGGLDYVVRRALPRASLVYFRRDSRDLIDFIACPPQGSGICTGRPYGTYDNVGRARSQGVEVEVQTRLLRDVQAGIAYAFTVSTNRATGLRLARRPRHAGTFGLDWQALRRLSLGADLRVVSASFDDVANTGRLGGHALLDLRASWAVSGHFDLYGRIENAGDERYQTALGYAQQGRAAFVGVRARL
ncbi:MAG: TonB-dependent receptor [Alteraurantiacibacter sp.]